MECTTGFRIDSPITPAQVKSAALPAENAHLRARLAQAGIDAERLMAEAGIQAVESDAAQRLQRLLLEEMHHRMKNTLAIIMGIVSQSLKNAATMDEGRLAVENRLIGLCRAQDLLMQANWSDSKLTDVIRVAVDPFDIQKEPKFKVEECALEIGAAAVLPLSLSLNELCTNAVKYGALSVATGRVAISLKVNDAAQRLNLGWIESGGPVVHEPARRSFGTRLVKVLAKQINGDVILRYEPDGFKYELDVPLATLHAHAAQR